MQDFFEPGDLISHLSAGSANTNSDTLAADEARILVESAAGTGGVVGAEGPGVHGQEEQAAAEMREDDEVVESDEAAEEEGSGVGGMQHYVFDGNKKGKWLIDSTNKGNVRVRRPQTDRQPDRQKRARTHTISTAKASVRHSIPHRWRTHLRPQPARKRAHADANVRCCYTYRFISSYISVCVYARTCVSNVCARI